VDGIDVGISILREDVYIFCLVAAKIRSAQMLIFGFDDILNTQ
jgi:hypothetical protein